MTTLDKFVDGRWQTLNRPANLIEACGEAKRQGDGMYAFAVDDQHGELSIMIEVSAGNVTIR